MTSICADGISDPLAAATIDSHQKQQETLQATKGVSSDSHTAKFTTGTRVEKSSPATNEHHLTKTITTADDVNNKISTVPALAQGSSKELNVEEELELMVSKDLILKKRAVGLGGAGGVLVKGGPNIGGDLRRFSKRSATIAYEARANMVIPGHIIIWGHELRWHDGLALIIGHGTLTDCDMDGDVVVQLMREGRLGGGLSTTMTKSQRDELALKPWKRHGHAIDIYTSEMRDYQDAKELFEQAKQSRGGLLDRLKRRLDDGHFKLLKSTSPSKLPETASIHPTQDDISERAYSLNYRTKVSGVDPGDLPIAITARPSRLQLAPPADRTRVAGTGPNGACDLMTITPWTCQDKQGVLIDDSDSDGSHEHGLDSMSGPTRLSEEPIKNSVLRSTKSKERVYDSACIGRTAPPVPPPKNPKRVQTRLYNNHPFTFVSGLQESSKTWPKSPDDPNWDDAVALLKYRAAEEKREAEREAKMAKKSEQEKRQTKQERHMKNALGLLERGNMLGLGPEIDFRNMTENDLLKLGEELEDAASRSQTKLLKNKFKAIDRRKAREDLALQTFLKNRIQNVANERERRAANQKDVAAAKAETARADYENSIRFTTELHNSENVRTTHATEDHKRPEAQRHHYTSSPNPDEQTRLTALRAIGLDPDQRSEYGDTDAELMKTLRHLCGDGTPVITAKGHVGLGISDPRRKGDGNLILDRPSIPNRIQVKTYSEGDSMVDLDDANVPENSNIKCSEQISIEFDVTHDQDESFALPRPTTRINFHSADFSETDDDASEYSTDPNGERISRQPTSPLFDPPLQVASSGKLHPNQFRTAAFYPERSESFNRKLRKVSEKRMVELEKQKSSTSLRQPSEEEASSLADWVHPALRGAASSAAPLPLLPSMDSVWDTQSRQDAFNDKCGSIIAFANESSLDKWFDEDVDGNVEENVDEDVVGDADGDIDDDVEDDVDEDVENKGPSTLHPTSHCPQASIDIQSLSPDDEGYGTGSYTRPVSQSPRASPRTSFHDDTMRELFAKIDSFRFPTRPSSKVEISNDCNSLKNLRSEILSSETNNFHVCDANNHRGDNESLKSVASVCELDLNVYPKPMVDLEHLVEQNPKISLPMLRSTVDHPHIVRSKSLQNLRTQNGLPPLKIREREEDKRHPSHEYTWLTEKLMCYSLHTPVLILPDMPDLPKDSNFNFGDLPSKYLTGQYEVPKVKLQRCACCQRSCCLYASKLQISMIDTNNAAEEHIRACAEAEVDKLRSIYPNGVDEFNTFLACVECSRVVCPRCADMCEEPLCHQVMCKDHASNGKCSYHEQIRPQRW